MQSGILIRDPGIPDFVANKVTNYSTVDNELNL